jgi:very-short-patch-repair endonuclease
MVGAADREMTRGADRRKVRIKREGCRVMRCRNNDVPSNRDGVLTVILEALMQESCVGLPLTPPSPRKSGERE